MMMRMMIFSLVTITGLQASEVKKDVIVLKNVIDESMKLRGCGNFKPAIIYSETTLESIKADIDDWLKEEKETLAYNNLYINKESSITIVFSHNPVDRSVVTKECMGDFDEWIEWRSSAFLAYLKKHKGLVIFDLSSNLDKEIKEKYIQEISAAVAQEDVSVIFNLSLGYKDIDIEGLCAAQEITPIVYNKPTARNLLACILM